MENVSSQSLHLVLGGELNSLQSNEFAEPEKLDVVGVFPDYHQALSAWKSASQQNVDNAMMRYYIVPLHYLLNPEKA